MSLLWPSFWPLLVTGILQTYVFFFVTEQKKQKLNEAKAGLDDAESLVDELSAEILY